MAQGLYNAQNYLNEADRQREMAGRYRLENLVDEADECEVRAARLEKMAEQPDDPAHVRYLEDLLSEHVDAEGAYDETRLPETTLPTNPAL